MTRAGRLVGTLALATLRPQAAFAQTTCPSGLYAVWGLACIEQLGTARPDVDSSLIQRSDEVNLVEALAGKAPNVQVVSAAGDPGASSFIELRGPTTLTGNGQPLLVVDGSPIDNSTIITGGSGNNIGGTVAPNRAADLNPADVASVSILSGPAAAALYGARGGQGVVLITTKSGQAGPTRTTFRSELLMNHVTQGPALQTMFGQGSDSLPPAGTTGEPPMCLARGCQLAPGSWGPVLSPGVPRYDHFNELFTTGYVSDNTLAVSGGDEKTLFYLSGEYLHNRGDLQGPNNYWQRAVVRLNVSQRLLNSLTLAGTFSYADTRGAYLERGSTISGVMLGALRTPAEFNNAISSDSATGLQRSYRYPYPAFGSATTSRGYDNPFFVLSNDLATSHLGRGYGALHASYRPLSWLKVEDVLGFDDWTDDRLEALAQSSSAFPTGEVTVATYKYRESDDNFAVTAATRASPTFSGTVTVGAGLSSRTQEQVAQTGSNLIAPTPFTLANTAQPGSPSDSSGSLHTSWFFGEGTADLYDQLYLTAGARTDLVSGSSGPGRWFPKASVAWEFTKPLHAGQGAGVLHVGRVRVAYGETGTEYGPFGFAGGGSFGAFVPPPPPGAPVTPTPYLPDRMSEIEGGADFGLWSGEPVDAHYTYYRASSAVPFAVPVAPSSGSLPPLSTATITNIGHEVTLNVRPIETADVHWSIGLQWAKNTNRVTSLGGAAAFVSIPNAGFADPQGVAFAPQRSSTTGQVTYYPVGELRGSDFVRCGRGLSLSGYGYIDTLPGMCKDAPNGAVFLGTNGYPQLDPNYEPIADPTPKWTGSVQTVFRYKKWTISGLLDIKHGGQMWNGTKGALTYFGTAASTWVRGQTLVFGQTYYQQFTFAGPGVGKSVLINQTTWFGYGAADTTAIGSGFTGPSSQFVEDAGFVKLREIAIAYQFSQPWVLRTLGFDAIDLRVSGRNLETWTNYTGIDPESSLLGADVAQQGFDYFGTPQTRSVAFSVTLHH